MGKFSNDAPKRKFGGKVTMSGFVYHQEPEEQPSSFPVVWSRGLVNSEQPYKGRNRDCVATPSPKVLNYGYVEADRIALLVIGNLSADKTLRISKSGDSSGSLTLVIRQGEAYPICCENYSNLTIQCLDGDCKYSLIAIPG